MTAQKLLYCLGLALVCALAVTLRAEAVRDTVVIHPLRADALDYFSYAYNIRQFSVYSRERTFLDHHPPRRADALRSPGYPAFAALFIDPADVGESVANILWAQVVLSIATVLVWGYLGYRLLGAWGSLLCALFVAISPHLVNINVYVLSEPLFTFELGIAFLIVYHLIKAQGKRLWLLAVVLGLVLGAANLTRASVIGWWVVFLPICLLPTWRRWLFPVGLAAAIFFGMNAAWALRNHAAIGQWSDKTLEANFLQHGMYPGFMYHDQPKSLGIPYRYDPQNAALAAHPKRIVSAILHRFHDRPWTYLRWYLLGKPLFLYAWNIVAGMGDSFVYPVRATPYAASPLFRISHAVAYGLHWPLLALALLGALALCLPSVRTLFEPESRWFLAACALFLAYFTAFHMIGAPFPRYGIPVQPLVYLMALVPPFILWKLRAAAAAGQENRMRAGGAQPVTTRLSRWMSSGSST